MQSISQRRTFNANVQDGATPFMLPVGNMVSASAQLAPLDGTESAYVLTIVVSNDPTGKKVGAHPSNITLSSSTKITPVFSVVGYLHFGVQLTTLNGAALTAEVFLVAKDSPA